MDRRKFLLIPALLGYGFSARGQSSLSAPKKPAIGRSSSPVKAVAELSSPPRKQTAASGYPAWRAGKAVLSWVTIPNSTFSAGVKEDYFAALGLELPSKRAAPWTNYIHYGTNDKGATNVTGLNNKYTFGSRYYGFHGMALDARDSSLWIGGGDAETPENSYHKLLLEHDVPIWTPAVIKGTHKDHYKHSSTAAGGPWIPAGPSEYDLPSEHYDGRPRGGHMYWNQEIVTGYNGADRLVHWASNQFYDRDGGNDYRVRAANLATGEYEIGTSKIIASLAVSEGDTRPWKQQHPVTQDQYMIRGDRLYVWRKATNTYQIVYDSTPLWGQWGLDDVSMSINWEENYILCEGGVSSAHATRVIFVLDLNTPQGANLATKIDVARFDGPAAGAINLKKYGAMVWCPDLHKFLVYTNNAPNLVYSVERTATNKFHADVVATTGTPPPVARVGAGPGGSLGGMLNKWRYIPRLKMMVAHLQLRDPMYALIVA